MKEVMKIVFATNNNHKLSEIRDILNEACEVKSLKEIGCNVDIPETGTTLEENALIKANYVWDHFHTNVFADDTGLEVEALNGEPGVYSARYAGGEGHDSEANIQKVLKNLEGIENRKARFRTVIAFVRKNKVTGEKKFRLSKVSSMVASPPTKGEPLALDTMPSSFQKDTTKPLENLEWTLKTRFLTVQEP